MWEFWSFFRYFQVPSTFCCLEIRGHGGDICEHSPRPQDHGLGLFHRTHRILQTIADPWTRHWLNNVWSWQTLLIYRMLQRLIALLSFFFFLPAPYRRNPCSCSGSHCQRHIKDCFDVARASSVPHTGTSQGEHPKFQGRPTHSHPVRYC